jgi:hypothetical protein
VADCQGERYLVSMLGADANWSATSTRQEAALSSAVVTVNTSASSTSN